MTHPPAGPANPPPRPGPSKDLATFEFPATAQPVRTVVLDGEPWFVARDVCAVLDIANGRDAVSRLDDDGVGTTDVIDSMGRTQSASIVNEAGLYELIFQSRKPEAKAFRRWVTQDVLPAIRKTGSYAVEKRELSRRELAQMVIEEADRADRAEQRLAIAAPKAEAWNTLASADGDFSVADAAKILARDPQIQIGERRLFTLLREWGWIYRQGVDQRWRVYQQQVETGRLSEIPKSHYHPKTGELVLDPPQVRVTVKGIEEIRRRLVGQLAIGAGR